MCHSIIRWARESHTTCYCALVLMLDQVCMWAVWLSALFFMMLEFELRTLCFLGSHSTTWDTPLVQDHLLLVAEMGCLIFTCIALYYLIPLHFSYCEFTALPFSFCTAYSLPCTLMFLISYTSVLLAWALCPFQSCKGHFPFFFSLFWVIWLYYFCKKKGIKQDIGESSTCNLYVLEAVVRPSHLLSLPSFSIKEYLIFNPSFQIRQNCLTDCVFGQSNI
jgi:hypothetical protein